MIGVIAKWMIDFFGRKKRINDRLIVAQELIFQLGPPRAIFRCDIKIGVQSSLDKYSRDVLSAKNYLEHLKNYIYEHGDFRDVEEISNL
ncbi:hypothetical protein, partial [Vibrio harveyi]